MLTADDFTALWLTLQLAAFTTGILLLIGTPLAWWLAHTRWRLRFVLETLIALPLVLPPTVLGFYSVLYSLPFVVQPLQDTFQSIGRRPLEIAATLRAGPIDTFFNVVIPLARAGYVTAAMLGFAHTLGEFGVVLMIGGNIAGETRVLSIAIYDHVESLEYGQAHILAGGMLLLSFCILLTVYGLRERLRVIRL